MGVRNLPPTGSWKGTAVAIAAAVLVLGALRPAVAAEASRTGAGVDYVLAPALDADGARLTVRVTFKTGVERQTRLRTPLAFASESHLDRNLSGWRAQGATITARSPGVVTLTHAPNATITVAYDVRSGRRPGVIRDRLEYQPDISAAGVFAFGETFISYPEGARRSPARLRLEPGPPGWQAYADAETSVNATQTVDDVLHGAVIAGPDVRLATRDVGGATLRIAFRGAFNFKDDAFADLQARIVRAERKFWDDGQCPCFISVDALEGAPVDQHQAGIGRTHGAAMFASPHLYLSNFAYVMAHEPEHIWIADRLGGLPPGPAEAGAYWFSEGFTDFFAYRTLLRTGVWKLSDYVALGLERTAEDRPLPQRRLAAEYWNNPDLYQAPYLRGLLLAVIWDDRIRKATGGRMSLDDVLRAQRRRAAAGGPTADALFPAVYKELSGVDLSGDIARYIVAGEVPEPPDDIFPGCLVPFRPAPGGLDGTANTPAGRVAVPMGPGQGRAKGDEPPPPPRAAVTIGPRSYSYLDDRFATEDRCLKLMSGE